MTAGAAPGPDDAGSGTGGPWRGPDGRLRLVWRLGAFLAAFLLLLAALEAIVVWAGGAPTVDRPLTWPAALGLALAALGASAWVTERLEGIPAAAVGLPLGPGTVRWLVLGFLTGTGIMAIAVAILVAGGWLSWEATAGTFWDGTLDGLSITALLLPAALGEEVVFRGYPLQALAERYGGAVAIPATALGFAAVHGANPSVDAFALVNLGLAGLVLGLAWWRTYSLWFATGLHLGWNWTMGVAVDLPVSGLTLDVAGFDAVLRGPELWTGGAFGPEGGLAVTLAACVGFLWLALSRSLRRDPVVLALAPLPEGRTGAGRRPGRARRGERASGSADPRPEGRQ